MKKDLGKQMKQKAQQTCEYSRLGVSATDIQNVSTAVIAAS